MRGALRAYIQTLNVQLKSIRAVRPPPRISVGSDVTDGLDLRLLNPLVEVTPATRASVWSTSRRGSGRPGPALNTGPGPHGILVPGRVTGVAANTRGQMLKPTCAWSAWRGAAATGLARAPAHAPLPSRLSSASAQRSA